MDASVRLRDAASGQALRRLARHMDTVLSAAYSPDGRRIVTASWDHTTRFWDAGIADLLAQALIQRAPPIFTTEERQRYGLDE